MLTKRQLEVLCLVGAGCTKQAIANKLVIKRKTVYSHLSNIRKALKARDDTHAVFLALRKGYMSLDDIPEGGANINHRLASMGVKRIDLYKDIAEVTEVIGYFPRDLYAGEGKLTIHLSTFEHLPEILVELGLELRKNRNNIKKRLRRAS